MNRPKRYGFERGDHVTLSFDSTVHGRVALSQAGVVTVHIPTDQVTLYVRHTDVRHIPAPPRDSEHIFHRVRRNGEPSLRDMMSGVIEKPTYST